MIEAGGVRYMQTHQKAHPKSCANPTCNNIVRSKRSIFCSHACYTDYEKEYFRHIRGEGGSKNV